MRWTVHCALTINTLASPDLKFVSARFKPIDETHTFEGQLGALGICSLWLQLERLPSGLYHTHPSTSNKNNICFLKSFPIANKTYIYQLKLHL